MPGNCVDHAFASFASLAALAEGLVEGAAWVMRLGTLGEGVRAMADPLRADPLSAEVTRAEVTGADPFRVEATRAELDRLGVR